MLAPLWGFLYVRRLKELTCVALLDVDLQKSTGHPVADAIKRAWAINRRVPRRKELRKIARKCPPQSDASITILGEVDVPPIDAPHFEPEIFSPSDQNRSMLSPLFIGLVWLSVALLGFWGLLPFGRSRIVLMQGITHISLGSLWLAWLWGFRPRYLRFAPGVIQVLTYSTWGKRKPLIRSYPIGAGTRVIVLAPFRPPMKQQGGAGARAHKGFNAHIKHHSIRIVLIRAGMDDVWRLGKMRSPSNVIRAFWRAVLSTAPTPPLNEHELVG